MASEKRLIDANALLGELADIMREMPEPKDHYDNGYYSGLDRAFEIIEQAPTVEVVHGQWIVKHNPITDPKGYFIRIVCSQCDLHTGQKSNYCPQCGAKMDGGDENGF